MDLVGSWLSSSWRPGPVSGRFWLFEATRPQLVNVFWFICTFVFLNFLTLIIEDISVFDCVCIRVELGWVDRDARYVIAVGNAWGARSISVCPNLSDDILNTGKKIHCFVRSMPRNVLVVVYTFGCRSESSVGKRTLVFVELGLRILMVVCFVFVVRGDYVSSALFVLLAYLVQHLLDSFRWNIFTNGICTYDV